MSKSVQRRRKSQKKDKNIYETFKGSSVYPSEEPSPAQPFLSSVQQEKVLHLDTREEPLKVL
jgi:hypothetical protein